MSRQRDLTKGNIFRNVISLAWPMVLGNVLQNAFNVVDMIFVGRLGPASIAAVAICGLLMSVTWTLLVGLSVATTAIVARFYGAGNTAQVRLTAMQSLTLGVVIAVVLALFGNLLGRPVLRLLGAKEEVLELALGYLRIVFTCSFSLVLFFLSSSVMRGIGDSLTPMLIMTASTVLNIALDPLLIFGLWVFPRMGVRGAALATVIAQSAAMAAALIILFTGGTRVRLSGERYRLDFDLIKRLLRLAFPATLQGAVRSAAGFVLMRIVTGYGVFVTAAYGIGLRLDLIVMMPGWAMGGATSTLVGQNLGAGNPERSARSAWIGAGLYLLILVVVGCAFFGLAPSVIRIFNSDAQIVAAGAAYLRMRTLGYLFLALAMVMTGALNGAGDPLTPMLVLAVSLLAVQIPLALILPRFLAESTMGIWLAILIAQTIQGVAMAGWFLTGRWKTKKV